jgi:hypothetical protein
MYPGTLLFPLVLLLAGCSLFLDDDDDESPSLYVSSFPRETWGEWLSPNTITYDKYWYITPDNIDDYDLLKGSEFTRISPRVLEVSEPQYDGSFRTYTLIGSRLPDSTFTGRVVVPGGSPGGRKVTVQNDYNSGLSETFTTAADGTFTATNVIAGDPYTISCGNYRKTFTAFFDRDTAGALNLTDQGNIQCTLTPLPQTDPWMLYGGKDYDFTLTIENPGASDYFAPSYELRYDRGKLSVTVSPDVFTIATVEAGARRQLRLTLRASVTEDAVIPLGVRFTESFSGAVWEDWFAIRFYSRPAKVEIRNDSFDNAVAVIVPMGRTYGLSPSVIGHDGITTVHFDSMDLPRSSGQYLLAFKQTGYPWQDAIGNGAFWLGFDLPMSNTQAVLKSIPDTEKEEPMDSEDRAKRLVNVREIKGFIHEGDIDFYKLTLPREDFSGGGE